MKFSSFLPAFGLLPLVYGLPSTSLSGRDVSADKTPPYNCLVENNPIGRTTMRQYALYSPTPGDSVKTIRVWSDYSQTYGATILFGLQVVFDGKMESPIAGRANGKEDTFTFNDGEKIATLEIAGGSALDRVAFTTTESRSFSAGGQGGSGIQMDVGNGVLESFRGNNDSQDLYSIAPVFYTTCPTGEDEQDPDNCDCSNPLNILGGCIALCL